MTSNKEKQSSSLNRRRFILGTSVMATSLAGCTGSSDDDDSEDDDVAKTQQPDTTAEAQSNEQNSDNGDDDTDASGEAAFELVEINAPEEVAIGEDHSFSITIENTGGADGVWSNTLIAKEGDGGQWEEIGVVELEVPAGDTATWEINEFSVDYNTALTYRLDEIGEEFVIRYVSATLAFGEEYVSPDGMAFMVDSIEFFDSYTWSGTSGNTYEETAPAGSKWAKVYVTAENKGTEQQYTPFSSDVNIITGNQQYDEEYLSDDDGVYEQSEVSPGIVREGWIAYEVPEDLSKDDLRVQWADDNFTGAWTVYWSPSA